ncbi:ABC transporter permease [Brucepastera parasyntrophica]|uniref:ABC transporter permease n=1 Tax=Brucepastera parasyntrophica TaxID=2880008 RepID=UPI00210BE851|nr:ABC transporter permease [Brucepastera parasyntrophica]ULQ58736.1 ABC transporter permease [Brucepastera parasyntrophica]
MKQSGRRIKTVFSKDIGELTSNPMVLVPMIIVPVIICVFLPVLMTVLVLVYGANAMNGADMIMDIIAEYPVPGHILLDEDKLMWFFMNFVFIPLFLIVPLMCSIIIVTNGIIGEKERKTLETLLLTPISNREFILAKLLAGFIPAFCISAGGFALFSATVTILYNVFRGYGIIAWGNWLAVVLLLSPGISVLGLAIALFSSLKAKSFMEAQQVSVLVVLPLIAVLMGQLFGVLVLNLAAIIIGAAALALLDWLLLYRVLPRFTRESIISLL